MSTRIKPTAVVTGASRGIGVALTRALAGAGYIVYAVARDSGRLHKEYDAEIVEGSILPAALDICDAAGVNRFFADNFSPGKDLDLLFNNAGRFVSLAPIWDADPDEWWNDVSTNLRGTFLVTRAALAGMLRADRGIIVNMGGGRPPGASGYAASRAAVAELSRALADELRRIGSKVSVYLADPGLVATDMTLPHARSHMGEIWVPDLVTRVGSGDTRRPEEIAEKLIGQLPYMSAATSGGFFDPDTATGSFRSIA